MTERINKPAPRTLGETKAAFPPRPSQSKLTVTIGRERQEVDVDSMVSRNESGVIVYVVPRSTHFRDPAIAALMTKNTPEE